MARFCPKCGEKIEKNDDFCEKCRAKNTKTENLIKFKKKDITVRICEECSRFFLKNKWKPFKNKKEAYIETVKQHLKDNSKEELTKLKIIPLEEKDGRIKYVKIEHLVPGGKTIKQKVKTDRTICNDCSKKKTSYLEGTLQLRGVNEKIFEALKKELENAEKKFAHVTHVKELRDAIDIDMTSQKQIAKIAKNLHKKFGGELKIDYRLHTKDKQTNKEIYRITATVIFPKVIKGDVIEYEEQPYIVVAVGKEINAKNLITKRKRKIGFREKYKILEKIKTTISKTYPKIEALDPVTFQSEELIMQKPKELKQGQKITVVRFKKQLFLI